MAGQLPKVLAQGDAARLLTTKKQLFFFTQATGQRGFKNGLGWARAIPHLAAIHQPGAPAWQSHPAECWRDPGEPELATHPPSTARVGHPGSLLAASTRHLSSRVAPTKPSPEPAASARQKARKEEKSSLFQKA